MCRSDWYEQRLSTPSTRMSLTVTFTVCILFGDAPYFSVPTLKTCGRCETPDLASTVVGETLRPQPPPLITKSWLFEPEKCVILTRLLARKHLNQMLGPSSYHSLVLPTQVNYARRVKKNWQPPHHKTLCMFDISTICERVGVGRGASQRRKRVRGSSGSANTQWKQ